MSSLIRKSWQFVVGILKAFHNEQDNNKSNNLGNVKDWASETGAAGDKFPLKTDWSLRILQKLISRMITNGTLLLHSWLTEYCNLKCNKVNILVVGFCLRHILNWRRQIKFNDVT